MSLLSDLQEDLIADALAKPAVKREPEWKPSTTWTFNGYLARVISRRCPSCQGTEWQTLGVFSEEVGTNGTRKLLAVSQFPTTGVKRLEVEQVDGPICASCLTTNFGFTDLVESPQVKTNIAGQGLLGVQHS